MDKPKSFTGEQRQTAELAPELRNAEQEEEQNQAQTLADEAVGRSSDDFGLEDSEKVSTGGDNDDVQDLVDHMKQMVSSGRIDNSAYLGEPNHDDEDETFLPTVHAEDSPVSDSEGE